VATDWLPLISRLELLKAHAGRKPCHVPLHEILIYRFILRSKVAVALIFTPEGLLDSHNLRLQRRSSKPAEVRRQKYARILVRGRMEAIWSVWDRREESC